jgi:ribonuclease VapC
MVLDTSAIVAWIEDEALSRRLGAALSGADALHISAGTLLELCIVVESRRGESGGRELDLLLHRLGVTTVPVSAEHVERARAAYREFGKGRHHARLNFGDCFAYALATELGEPLLFTGDDFTHTDVVAAEY